MRNRNILKGRCGHRPLRTTTEKRRILKGGRPCPPAGIVWFHGNPMQIHNILMGRCGHRPLQTTAENRRILRADRVVRPYNRYWKIVCGSKNRRVFRFAHPQKNANTSRGGGRTLLYWVSFSRRRGRCPHRPAEGTRFMVLFRRIRVDFPVRPYNRYWKIVCGSKNRRVFRFAHPQKRKHPARGRMGTTDEARGGAFRVMSSGLSA